MFSFIHTYRVSHRTFPVVFFLDSFGKPQDIELKFCIGIFQTFRPCGLVWPYLTLYGLIWLHMVLLLSKFRKFVFILTQRGPGQKQLLTNNNKLFALI